MVKRCIAGAGVVVAIMVTGIGRGETDRRDPPGVEGEAERQDRKDSGARERACKCCSDCIAAKRSVRGKEEGPPAQNGCQDCCRRCGNDEMQLQRDMPPEIVK